MYAGGHQAARLPVLTAAHSLALDIRQLGEAPGTWAGGWGCCCFPTSGWLGSKARGHGGLRHMEAQEGWGWQVEKATSMLVHLLGTCGLLPKHLVERSAVPGVPTIP